MKEEWKEGRKKERNDGRKEGRKDGRKERLHSRVILLYGEAYIFILLIINYLMI